MLKHQEKRNPPIEASGTVRRVGKGVTCPSCGYARQSSDLAPAWQCPSCGVAYVKVSEQYKWAQKRKTSSQIDEQIAYSAARKKIFDRAGYFALAGWFLLTSGFSGTCAANSEFMWDNPAMGVLGILVALFGAVRTLRSLKALKARSKKG